MWDDRSEHEPRRMIESRQDVGRTVRSGGGCSAHAAGASFEGQAGLRACAQPSLIDLAARCTPFLRALSLAPAPLRAVAK